MCANASRHKCALRRASMSCRILDQSSTDTMLRHGLTGDVEWLTGIWLISGHSVDIFNQFTDWYFAWLQTRVLVYLMHSPAGTSTMNMFHWVQMVNSGKMQAYDYESVEENVQHYGQVCQLFSLVHFSVLSNEFTFWFHGLHDRVQSNKWREACCMTLRAISSVMLEVLNLLHYQ